MVNWQKVAIEDLKKYAAMKNSLSSIRQKQAELDSFAGAVRSSFSSTTPVSGSGSSMHEDKLVSNIVERERLNYNYTAVKMLVGRLEKALDALDDKERLVLERFYIDREKDHVERLCNELGYEKSQVYNIRERALRKFTYELYGIQDF